MNQKADNPEPIGRVTIRDAKGVVVVTLAGYDRWHVTVDGRDCPEIADIYRLRYAGSYTGSPQDGFYGQLILRDLAEQTGGTLEMTERFAAPDSERILY